MRSQHDDGLRRSMMDFVRVRNENVNGSKTILITSSGLHYCDSKVYIVVVSLANFPRVKRCRPCIAINNPALQEEGASTGPTCIYTRNLSTRARMC